MVLYSHKQKIGIIVGFFLALCIIGYGLFQARNIILGPQISLTSPKNGATLTNSLVTVSGKASNVSFLSLNDRPIFIDQQGDFNEQLLLSPGYNTWTLVAQDKFGRTISKNFSLIFNKS